MKSNMSSGTCMRLLTDTAYSTTMMNTSCNCVDGTMRCDIGILSGSETASWEDGVSSAEMECILSELGTNKGQPLRPLLRLLMSQAFEFRVKLGHRLCRARSHCCYQFDDDCPPEDDVRSVIGPSSSNSNSSSSSSAKKSSSSMSIASS